MYPRITHVYTPANDTNLTVAALATFALCCLKLYDLTLPRIDLSSVHLLPNVPLVPQHPLRRLSLPVVVCGDTSPVQIAVTLYRIFPELDELWVVPDLLPGRMNPLANSSTCKSQIREYEEAFRAERARKRENACQATGGAGHGTQEVVNANINAGVLTRLLTRRYRRDICVE